MAYSKANPIRRASSSGSSKQIDEFVRQSYLCSSFLGLTICVDLQQLGDSLGKGAFGQVYRSSFSYASRRAFLTTPHSGALNMQNGETVAVKAIHLGNLPEADLAEVKVCTSAESP